MRSLPGEIVCRRLARRVAAGLVVVSVLATVGVLSSCNSPAEATAAATKLTATSQQLTDYYTDLTKQMDDTIALNQVQSETMGIPFDDSDRQRMETTRQELDKRA